MTMLLRTNIRITFTLLITSTRSSNRIYDYYNIPYCGHMLKDTKFYNKNIYPNLFRLNNQVNGNHFAQLFRWMNVSNIALIAGPSFDGGKISESMYASPVLNLELGM